MAKKLKYDSKFLLGSRGKLVGLSVLVIALALAVGAANKTFVNTASKAKLLENYDPLTSEGMIDEYTKTEAQERKEVNEAAATANKAGTPTGSTSTGGAYDTYTSPSGLEYCAKALRNACYCATQNCFLVDNYGYTYGCKRNAVECNPEALGSKFGEYQAKAGQGYIDAYYNENDNTMCQVASGDNGGNCIPFTKNPLVRVANPPPWFKPPASVGITDTTPIINEGGSQNPTPASTGGNNGANTGGNGSTGGSTGVGDGNKERSVNPLGEKPDCPDCRNKKKGVVYESYQIVNRFEFMLGVDNPITRTVRRWLLD